MSIVKNMKQSAKLYYDNIEGTISLVANVSKNECNQIFADKG